MEKELLEFLDSRRDIAVDVETYKHILADHILAPINTTTFFLNVVARIPTYFIPRERHEILKFLTDHRFCALLYSLGGNTDSLKEAKVPLKWARSFIDLEKYKLPNVRAIDHDGQTMMMDDVTLCVMIFDYVKALPKYFYTPVKRFVYFNIPELYEKMFKPEDDLRFNSKSKTDEFCNNVSNSTNDKFESDQEKQEWVKWSKDPKDRETKLRKPVNRK